MAARLRVLAIAAATGRIGMVFLIGGELMDWRLSRNASRSPALAASQTAAWIEELRPDVCITERDAEDLNQGPTLAAADSPRSKVTSADAPLSDISVLRRQPHDNKYEEAENLAERFPELKAWVPRKRRIWESEPRQILLFEALALALTVLDDPDEGSSIS
jgi:hypothetical protein